MNESIGVRIWRAGLTGIPFGVYKMGFGWYEYHHGHLTLGSIAMVWGAIDVLLNVASVPFPKSIGWCLLANIGRWIDQSARKKYLETLLLAIDTMASVMIVAGMIWFGRLPLEPETAAIGWNLAVVGNVLSVGLEQLYMAITKQKRE